MYLEFFSTYQEQAPCHVAGKAETERRKGGGKGLGVSGTTSFGGTCNSHHGVCLCPVQAPHRLFHGLPGPWALDGTPGNLPSLQSWGVLIEIFHMFETLRERLACGRRSQSQPCLLGGLPVSCLAHSQPLYRAPWKLLTHMGSASTFLSAGPFLLPGLTESNGLQCME